VSAPPRRRPSARMPAFIAPALVPLMPTISKSGSCSSRSSTPHVNAPCEPPPCRATAMRRFGFGDVLMDFNASRGVTRGILKSQRRGNYSTEDACAYILVSALRSRLRFIAVLPAAAEREEQLHLIVGDAAFRRGERLFGLDQHAIRIEHREKALAAG